MIRAEQQFVLEPLADADAVRLFVQRAQAAGARLPADEAATACMRPFVGGWIGCRWRSS